MCGACLGRRAERERRAQEEAKCAADAKRLEMLASEDPAILVRAVAQMTYASDRVAPLKAWQDYLRIASVAPQFELVTLTPGTRKADPSEVGREPLWCHTAVEKPLGRNRPRSKLFYLDADGNYLGDYRRPEPRMPVGGACVLEAGAPLRCVRYARGTDKSGRAQISVEGALAVSVSPRRPPAPGPVLVTAICALAGVTAPDFGLAWSAIFR